jgi:hypothetical protein
MRPVEVQRAGIHTGQARPAELAGLQPHVRGGTPEIPRQQGLERRAPLVMVVRHPPYVYLVIAQVLC